MAGVKFVLDDADAKLAIGRIERAVANMRPAMEAIGAHFVFASQRHIETERDPAGRPWPPLSPRTAERLIGRKRRRGYDHMLRVTTRLYRSLVYAATGNSVEWGSNVEYARIHQEGGEVKIEPHTATVYLKKVRVKGLKGLRSRFVRSGTKGAEARQVQHGGRTIIIPPRPYLGVSPADREEIPRIAADSIAHQAAL
jgi:phage gpG-like protein